MLEKLRKMIALPDGFSGYRFRSPNWVNGQNEGGFILVITMIILVLLTIIGISATSLTNIELQIAGNDRVHKETFYQADGGTEVGMLMIEENISCPLGFKATGFNDNDPDTFVNLKAVQVADSKFALDENQSTVAKKASHSGSLADMPADDARSIRIPADITNPVDTNPHTNLVIFGDTQLMQGSAIQMAAGYEGKGKGAAALGAMIDYDIYSQHIGQRQSESVLVVEWKHLVGQEGVCRY